MLKFHDMFGGNLGKVNTSNHQVYFLGGLNINLYANGKYIFGESFNRNKNKDSFTKSTTNTSLFQAETDD